MKRVLLNILVACLPVVGANAYDFWRSGIYFDIISDVEGTVKVTNQSDLDNQVAYTGDVVIPETVYNEGITWRVISISENAFRQCKYMTSLTIPKTITSIGQGTCEGCTSLKTVTLNNNTLVSIDRQSTSLASFFGTQVEKYVLGDVVQKIGKLAFSGCTQLGEVYIPESVTSIYSDAFYGCENLKTVTLLNKEWVSNDRNYNNSLCHYFGKQVEEYVLNDELTAIGNYAFYDCNGLKRITIPQNVESVGNYAFSGCESLEQIDLPQAIGTIGKSAFQGCSALEEVTIPTEITRIEEGTFSGCSSLTSLTIPNKVTSIGGGAFAGCSGLSTLTIPSQVTEIAGSVLSGCNLSMLTIEDGTETLEWSDPYRFSETSIAEVYLGRNISYYSKAVGSLFSSMKTLTSLTIGDHVTSLGVGICSGCSNLTSVTLGNGITSIDGSAFYKCSALEQIEIPQNVKTIGSQAFFGCSSLAKIKIPENVTTIGETAFRDCSSLAEVELSPSLTEIGGYAFYQCGSLSSIVIPESVTTIGNGAFYGCTSLSEVVIPQNVTELGYAFRDCMNLKTVTVNSNTLLEDNIGMNSRFGSQVTQYILSSTLESIADEKFSYCTDLTTIAIPESVKAIGNRAFNECKSLTAITVSGQASIGDLAFYGCTSMASSTINASSLGRSTFYGCSSLASLTLEEGLTTIGEYCFYGCSSLPGIKLPVSVVEIGNNAFRSCSSLSEVQIPCPLATIYEETFEYCDAITTAYIECKSIENYAFSDKNHLSSLTLGPNVTSIGYRAFDDCSNLLTLDIQTTSLIINSDWFSGCGNIATISIAGGAIGESAFKDRKKLTSITLGDGVTSIGKSAFYGCSSLPSITLPNSLTTIGENAFYNATSLQTIVIPNSVTDIGDGAFYGCSNLSTLDIQATSLTINSNWFSGCDNIATVSIAGGTIGEGAFASMKKLTSITLGDGVTSIGKYAFKGCSSLPSVILPNSLVTIGEYAFAGTTSLLAIAIPNSVTSIGRWAFEDSGALEAVHITDMAAWCGITFGENWNGYSSDEGFNLYLNDEKVTSLIIPKEATTVNPLAFYNCKDIESITVEGNEVYDSRQDCNAIIETESNTLLKGCKNSFVPTDVTAIADYAFLNCDGLTAVTLGREMQSIGQQAFDGCKLRNVLVKNAMPPTASGSSFSAQTFYHTTLYIPTGSWDDYAYDDSWYRFINIRETATTEAQLTMQQAYTLMDANQFCYSVYDPVNDCIGTISTVSGIDENNPNHCWQVIEAEGSHYLYNIGAKKFAVSSGGGFVLSDVASSIEMKDGADGIVLGEQQTCQWAMVSNERMSVEQNVIDDINTGMQLTTLPQQTENRYYDLNGRQLQQPKKGLNIVRTADGRIVKSFKK